MIITVNGESRAVEDGMSAATLVESLGLGAGWVVLEVNRAVIQRAELARIVLAEGDVVEIVKAVAGG